MYPDAYEVGLPNQGVQILYEVLNERDDALCERVYAVWPDMEALLRERRIPAFTIDAHRPVAAFDVLGVSFSTELGYTNLLTALDLAGILMVGPLLIWVGDHYGETIRHAVEQARRVERSLLFVTIGVAVGIGGWYLLRRRRRQQLLVGGPAETFVEPSTPVREIPLEGPSPAELGSPPPTGEPPVQGGN